MSRRAPEFRVITPRSPPPAAQFLDARARYVCAIAVVSELDHPVPQSGLVALWSGVLAFLVNIDANIWF